MACARAAPSLLLHVNIFLVLFAGAGLATGARLKWDPSTYVPLREVFPREYRAAAVALPLAAGALLLLAHCAVLALRIRRLATRRLLLLLEGARYTFQYAFLMTLMMCGEAALAWWLCARAAAWTRSPAAAELQHALRLREHLLPLLQQLAHWHPLPSKLKGLVQEAEADAPRNMHAALAAAALLALLQALAVLLALLLAARPPRTPHTARSDRSDRSDRADRAARRPRALWREHSAASTPLSTPSGSDKTPPRVVYRDGRLVVCGAATTPHSA